MKFVVYECIGVKFLIFKYEIYIRYKIGVILGFWNVVGYNIFNMLLKYVMLV